MILDSSAVLAVLQNEPEASDFERLVSEADRIAMSATSLLEAKIVVEARYGGEGQKILEEWLAAAGVEIVPFDGAQADFAYLAFRSFGKGRHVAGLNFGDCMAYALAAIEDEPLLFKGDDFSHTDITPAFTT